jgi:hypothetical protein
VTQWQRARLSDFLGQRVIYRNLAPVDPSMIGLEGLWQQIGLDRYEIPRKTSLEYAKAVWLIVQQAQELRGVRRPLERVLLIGDSARNDGAVAGNMGLDRPTRAFIGVDDLTQPKRVEVAADTMTANRWGALADMLSWLNETGFVCDETLAVLVDLDKTTIGARGRNDRTIDLARVRAAERTAAGALGGALDVDAFRNLYARLNKPECHWITEDNQDYVAYLCLMASGVVFPEGRFWEAMEGRQFADVIAFSDWCEDRAGSMTPQLLVAHREVWDGLHRKDPTPFKSFRNDEFLETIALMDVLPDEATAEQVLEQEIVITAEVADTCRLLTARGALVFGLSDKPDEASLPTPRAAERGYRAIHDTPMKAYGETVL